MGLYSNAGPLFLRSTDTETTVSIEEKMKRVIEGSVELEQAFMEAAHELRAMSEGTPASREVLESICRVYMSRARYDGVLRKFVEGAVKAGHLSDEYINGVIAGLQDKRDLAGDRAREFVLAERTQGVVN